MKLNHNCIRNVLLYFEEKLDCCNELDLFGFSCDGFSKEDTTYSIKKLIEAGYLSAKVVDDINGDTLITVYEITWNGHNFLDTIRDDTVWGHTQTLLSKFASTSLTFVSNIASQVLTNLVNQHLNGQI